MAAENGTSDIIQESRAIKSKEVCVKRRVSLKSSRIQRHSTAGIVTTTRQRRISQTRGTPRKSSLYQSESPSCSNNELKTHQIQSAGVTPVVSSCRRISVAVSRRPAFTMVEHSPGRRRSEPPYLTNMPTTNSRKIGLGHVRRSNTGRKFSMAEALAIRINRKLEVLAHDELLTCLNVSLEDEKVVAIEGSKDVSDSVVVATDTNGGGISHEEDQSRIKERKRREDKRKRIVRELLQTEQHYIACLDILNDVFKHPLEERHIVQENDLNVIFPSSLDDILNSHSNFMHDLERRVNDDCDNVGDCVSKMTRVSTNLVDMYTRYVTSFPKSISTLTKYTRGSRKFRKFLDSCYSNPLVERLDLPSFLLFPVQRLPRYILLLSELYKYTDIEHPDKEMIHVAKKEMEEIIISLDSSIKVSMELYNSNEWYKRSGFKLPFSTKRKKRTISESDNVKKDSDNEKKSTERSNSHNEKVIDNAKSHLHNENATDDENRTSYNEKGNLVKERNNVHAKLSVDNSSCSLTAAKLSSKSTPDLRLPALPRTHSDVQLRNHPPGEIKRGRDSKWRKSVGDVLSHWFQHDRSTENCRKRSKNNLVPHIAPQTPS